MSEKEERRGEGKREEKRDLRYRAPIEHLQQFGYCQRRVVKKEHSGFQAGWAERRKRQNPQKEGKYAIINLVRLNCLRLRSCTGHMPEQYHPRAMA